MFIVIVLNIGLLKIFKIPIWFQKYDLQRQ